MAIITFTSDFGYRDHYIAAVKAKIFNLNSNVTVTDISHGISHYDVAHAAFVVRSVFRDFPKGTVHLLAVNTLDRYNSDLVAVKLEDHYFVGADNGLITLISDQNPTAIVTLRKDEVTVFPEKDVLSKAAVFLASEKAIYDLGEQRPELVRMLNREMRVKEDGIQGNVIHVDHYGNLITNISKEAFEVAKGDRRFTVKIGREHIGIISDAYSRFDEGDCAVVFNDLGLLEIAINKGDASQLLGLRYDSPVSVQFT